MRDKIAEGDLLYHPVHGLCRMNRIIKQNRSGKDVRCYSLVPKIISKMKERFIIAVTGIETSGFHRLISLKEANDILAYLKTGKSTAAPARVAPKAGSSFFEQNQTWSLAQAVLTFSRDEFAPKDQRKRQMLERSVKGLVGELAFVFKMTLKETVTKLLKSLENTSKINPSVRVAFVNAGED